MKTLLEGILAKHGLSKKDAEIIAEDYLLGEKEGKKSHGLMAFPPMIEKIGTLKRGKIIVEKEGPSYALINGNENFGQLVGEKARKIAVKKAKKNGVAIIGAHNMLTFLRPGAQAEKIQEEGLIGIVVNNGGLEAIAPTGSIDAVLATNPVGFGIPTDETPIIADFATSKRAWGEVRVAKAEKRNLPENTFMDADGNFTTKPEKAESVAPFGDYKGYAIALLVEILTGSLVNMQMGIKRKDGHHQNLRGAIFIVIDPKKFTGLDKFKKANSALARQIKNSRKAKNVDEILVPGERAMKRKKKTERLGYFDIDDELYEKIRNLK